ncbi:sodium:calcium antiporter [Halomarina ordinaria]|uniref:Sodium:calcium antiporter n=1 Tax=Halomarina ordinaria TaxID=3033939 RepID=A0ABD5UB48_9EURY|nr:sodium:calcium antiporter [Halomarina sp. PSRA2]
MPLGVPPTVVGVVAFVLGVVLVVASVETFIEAVSESALALGVSGFFLTVLLAGTDLENAVLGVVAALDGLPALALGTVFGEALFILGAAVGLAGVLTPFETTVPRSYLLLMLGAPALLFALALDGTLTRGDGLLLTAGYLPLVLVVYGLERRSSTRYLSAEEVEAFEATGRTRPAADGDGIDGEGGEAVFDVDFDLDVLFENRFTEPLRERNEGWFRLGVAVAAAVGMTVGSELAVTGAEELLTLLGVTGLAFGATVMSFIASLEELFLTVEPVRRGRPHLGVGNVVGSVLFFVTANAGVVALVHPLDTSGTVLTVHWPFFLLTLVVVGGMFARGRVGRAGGTTLLALYAAYWGANYLV